MNKSQTSGTQDPSAATAASKRIILSMGGKGGVGKTSIMVGLAEWFDLNQIPVQLLDLDTENKARGSLTHFFGGRVPKVNIHSPAGLDAFIDHLADGAPVDLSVKFKSAYWKVLISAAVAALLSGFVIGVSYARNFDPPKQEIIEHYVETKCADLL